jgi:M6 family metalloprotease-like protein
MGILFGKKGRGSIHTLFPSILFLIFFLAPESPSADDGFLPPFSLSPPGLLTGVPGPPPPLTSFRPLPTFHPLVGTPPPTRGTLRILVIPIAYADLQPSSDHTSDPQYFSDLFFGGPRYPYASLRDYYLEQSLGALTITGTVLDWQISTKTREEIACKVGSSVNCNSACYGLGSQRGTLNISQGGAIALVGEALEKAVDLGIRLEDYDSNSDGVVDAVIVIHTGRGAEMTSNCLDLWSHQNEATFTVGGNPVTVHYLVGAERFYWPRTQQEFPSGIGVFAHEFGHILGLPDLYNILGNPQENGYGVGYYSLMGWGLYRWDGVIPLDGFGPDALPMALDPWSLERLGWVTPERITENQCLTSLPAYDLTPKVVSFPLNPTGSERLLVQYVRNKGFRAPLGASGVLIWHVDDAMEEKNPYGNISNCIPGEGNCFSIHPWVSLLQADGQYDLERGRNPGDPQDLFIGGQCLTEATTPSSRRWDGTDSKVRICVLSLSEGVSAKVNLVVDPSTLPPPPTILNIPADKGRVGERYTFSPKLYDPRGAHFSLTRRPEGMTIDPETGVLTWTPEEPGTYPVGIRVENCSGMSELKFTITVLSSEAPPKGCGCSLGTPPDLFAVAVALPIMMIFLFLLRRRPRP